MRPLPFFLIVALTAMALGGCGGFDLSLGPGGKKNKGGTGPDLKLFAVTASSKLISFNANNPKTLLTTQSVTGLQSGDSIVGIAFRPADGKLYALSKTRVYILDTSSAAAS